MGGGRFTPSATATGINRYSKAYKSEITTKHTFQLPDRTVIDLEPAIEAEANLIQNLRHYDKSPS